MTLWRRLLGARLPDFVTIPLSFGARKCGVPSTDPVPELPEPSAELILLLALVQAHLQTVPKKRRDAFLLSVQQSLGVQQAAYNVLKFRPRTEDAAVFRAMAQARSWWSQALGVLSWLE